MTQEAERVFGVNDDGAGYRVDVWPFATVNGRKVIIDIVDTRRENKHRAQVSLGTREARAFADEIIRLVEQVEGRR